MDKKRTIFLMASAFVLSMLVACGDNGQAASIVDEQTSYADSAETVSLVSAAQEVVVTENSEDHDDPGDYVWTDAEVILIALNGDTIAVDSGKVTVSGSTVTITSAGTYSISGSLTNGQIAVDTQDEAVVRLILNGVNIANASTSPINIINAEKVVIVLADNTENYVSDGSSYVFENAEDDEPNATIFSKSDLTIYGNGSLIVAANYNDGIASKDGLIIASGTITVNSVDDGIRGKDYIVVKNGNITINAQGDGMKSDNEEDASKGYITIETGSFNITSGGDAIQAQPNITIADGQFTLNTGGGSHSVIAEADSAKGIKSTVITTIHSGTFTIDSADDAIHSNGNIVVNSGTFVLASGDDGMHADANLEINGGDIQITRSYEGIESAIITINGGNIHVVASDDGINVAGGMDGSGMNAGPGRGSGPGTGGFTTGGNYFLYINGGYIFVEADGDGLDANGSIEMTNGVVIVNGPTMQMNGALDYDGTFTLTGGYFLAVGSSGMAQAPGQTSTQPSLLVNLDSAQSAGTLVHIQDSSDNDILTFAPTKSYQSIAFSSSDLAIGSTYDIYIGGSSTGTNTDGLYQGGSYFPGTQYTSLTLSSVVTGSGAGGGFGGGRGRP